MARAPNATSGIIFNEARLQKKSINHTQSFHCDNSFDEKYDQNTFSGTWEQRLVHGMVVKMHDDEHESCSPH